MEEFRFLEFLDPKLFHYYKTNFPIEITPLDVNSSIRFGLIEMQAEISLCSRFGKASVKQPRSYRDKRGTWTKPNFGRIYQITTSDSDQTCHICFLWKIVFITKVCK